MKLTETLTHQIARYHTNRQHFTSDRAKPEFLTAEYILKEILDSPPYRQTHKDKWELLEMTDEIFDNHRALTIKLPQKIPLMKHGEIPCGRDARISGQGGDAMELSPNPHSPWVQYTVDANTKRRKFEADIRHDLRQFNTLQALVRERPHLANLECIITALQHEKDMRKANQQRLKNEVLEPVVMKTDASTAIAKARLLGAKFLS